MIIHNQRQRENFSESFISLRPWLAASVKHGLTAHYSVDSIGKSVANTIHKGMNTIGTPGAIGIGSATSSDFDFFNSAIPPGRCLALNSHQYLCSIDTYIDLLELIEMRDRRL